MPDRLRRRALAVLSALYGIAAPAWTVASAATGSTRLPAPAPMIQTENDSDQDGLPDPGDTCPEVVYAPGFDAVSCAAQDGNPGNDTAPECKARERVVQTLLSSGVFTTHIAFAIVKHGELHFADAFSYIGQGQFVHDPAGIHRLYRLGSTSKAMVAVTAQVLAEAGVLSLDDFVSDEDGSQVHGVGERTLRQLLSHRGAFRVDSGALHLFCYPGDLAAFWMEPDDLVSPHYDSPVYGNLGGGYAYSAFNYALAGAYLANRTGQAFADIVQTRLFDPAGMCTATFDGSRAAATAIGSDAGVSQAAVMHVGPYINQVSQSDTRCEDNFYSSDDLPGSGYSWQNYRLDEAAAEARDPAGGVIGSVVDLAHFAATALAAYQGLPSVVSQSGIRDLWTATSDLGCAPNCPYQPYYGLGFFTNSQSGMQIREVEHGGSRAGYASGLVLRPERGLAVCVLANADVSTVALSALCKTILDDFEQLATDTMPGEATAPVVRFRRTEPNPVPAAREIAIGFAIPAAARVRLEVFDVRGRVAAQLADGPRAAGEHSVVWTPAARGLVPGVYFVRLSALGSVTSQRIVVLR